MLATKGFVYSLLSTNAALLSILGGVSHIVDAWPEDFLVFPLVIYQDDNQLDWDYADDAPNGSDVRVRIDIFTKLDLATTTTIGKAVDTALKTQLFFCGTNGEVQDPTEGVRHRVMRFSRVFLPSEIL